MSAVEPPDGSVLAPEPAVAEPAEDQTEDPPPSDAGEVVPADDTEAAEPLALYPPVVAVVVTRNPGPWFEDTLRQPGRPGLHRAHRSSSSTAVPTKIPPPRVAAVLPRAFVRRLDARAGFADAANEALRMVEGSTFLLLCHDDVVLDDTRGPGARGGGVPLQRRHPRPEAGERREPGDPARGRPRHRPLRCAVHRHRAGRSRPGAARRRARRLLRDHRGDAGPHRPLRPSSKASTPRRSRAPKTSTCAGGPVWPAPGCWSRPTPRAAHREAAGERTRADRPDEFALARSRVRVLLTSYSLPTPAVAGARRDRGGLHRGVRRSAHRSAPASPGRDRRLVLQPAPRPPAPRLPSARRNACGGCTTPSWGSSRSAAPPG